MRRIHWAAEAQDAHIVESLLRAHGIGAWSFDTGIVRLDWLKTLAFGGCRVMVADVDAERAHGVITAYRSGELLLTDEEVEGARCPRCHSFDGQEDRRPRRIVFLILIVSDPIFTAMFLLLKTPTAISLFAAACVAFNVALIFPGVAAWIVKSRFRCTSCGHAWRSPPGQTFAEMSRSVDNHPGAYNVAAQPVSPPP